VRDIYSCCTSSSEDFSKLKRSHLRHLPRVSCFLIILNIVSTPCNKSFPRSFPPTFSAELRSYRAMESRQQVSNGLHLRTPLFANTLAMSCGQEQTRKGNVNTHRSKCLMFPSSTRYSMISAASEGEVGRGTPKCHIAVPTMGLCNSGSVSQPKKGL
jgi:hypothetical protein